MGRKEAALIRQVKASVPKIARTAMGDFEIPNHSGDLSAGDILSTPIKENDPTNKKYVDDSIATHTADEDAHHDKAHSHDGADGSGTVAHSDTTGRTTDDHHDEAHTLASHTTKDHSELTSVTSDQHHAKLHAAAHEAGGDDVLELEKINSGFTDGSIPFIDSLKLAEDNAALFWDKVNKRLGIGTDSPVSALHIAAVDPTVTIQDSNNGTGGTSYRPHINLTAFSDAQVGSIGYSSNTDFRIKVEDLHSADFIIETGGSESMRVLNNGNVGIGRADPPRKLSVFATEAVAMDFESSNSLGVLFDFHAAGGGSAGIRAINSSNTLIGSAGFDTDTKKFHISKQSIPSQSPFFSLNLNNGDLELTKSKLTPIGGIAIKLTNKSGANSVAGDIVEVHATIADAVTKTNANADDSIGVFLDSGVADGSEAWVVISGIADVHMDAGGCAVHDRIITSATAGRGKLWNVGGAVATHFQEIGHALEAAAANGNARVVLHFN